MADLKRVAEELGLTDARTLLQSGNLLFQTKKTGVTLEKQLEGALTEQLALTTAVVVRSAAEWHAAIERNPFATEARKDPGHLVLMPLKAVPAKGAVAALEAAIVGRERIQLLGQNLYLVYPDGIGESKLTTALIEKKLGVTGTGRNWNTTRKIAALLA
jgi:uncharacterized protein (DUF1697 family)